MLLQCGPKELVKARVQYTFMNPGGQQLPLGEIPLPKLYVSMLILNIHFHHIYFYYIKIFVTCVWAILVSSAVLVWMRNKEHVVMLHGLLCMFI